MASSVEEITFWSEGFDYTLRKRAQRRVTFGESCILMDTILADVGNVEIPCFKCSGFSSLVAYIDYFKEELANMAFFAYPYIPMSRVDEMIRGIFALFIDAICTKYVCPHDESRGAVTLELFIEPRDTEEMAVGESFEMAAPVMMPATLESVEGLLALRLQQQEIQQFEDEQHRDCVICLDRIETRGTELTMPCSHVFHKDCLLQWLKNSHVCPLCRYEMPTTDLH